MEIHPEPEWESLYGELARNRGVALIMGMTDTGKSTLLRHLVRRFITEGTDVSLVDSDIGQSSLGLPGTVSMKVFHDEKDYNEFRFERMSFLGTANPAFMMSGLIETTQRMAKLCRKRSEITLIDTTGLVSGDIGKALKTGKIRAIKPDWVIALQKGDELEHVLSGMDDFRIIRIRSSPEVKARSMTERFRYRNRKLEDYFSGPASSEFTLNMNELRFIYYSKPFDPKEEDLKEGMIFSVGYHDARILYIPKNTYPG